MRKRLVLLLAIASPALSGSATFAQPLSSQSADDRPLVNRPDLASKFGALVCRGKVSTEAAWEAGIYDAYFEGQHIVAEGPAEDIRRHLIEMGQSSAQKMGHLGIATGSCDQKTHWVATSTAPAPIATDHAQVIQLPMNELRQMCRSARADFAPRSTGAPVAVKAKRGRIEGSKLGDGTLAVTCFPKGPAWQGPILWYLIPINAGPDANVPFHDVLTAAGPPEQRLAAWVNSIRQSSGLPGVRTDMDVLTLAMRSVLGEQSLLHDRRALKLAAEELRRGRFEFIGENRVIGGNMARLGWLLWNSPRHRELLLSPAATHLEVIGSQDPSGRPFAVLLFARDVKTYASRTPSHN